MQYRYKTPKEKPEKKPENKMKVVIEKNGEVIDDGETVRLTVSDEAKSKSLKKSAAVSVIILIIAAVICGFILYVGNYYRTAEYPDKIPENVSVRTLDNGDIAFIPANPVAGFIFYPGAKVEYTAYDQLMLDCAGKGILCILVKMPCNISLFDTDAADYCFNQFPEITDWYIGGHSLGGLSAADYASKNTDKLKGLILLGAYSDDDLSDSGLSVLTVYGSEDEILNMKRYEKDLSNLPSDMTELVIEGGCHSYFGNYGIQKGDGTPSITAKEQAALTADAIKSLVMSDVS